MLEQKTFLRRMLKLIVSFLCNGVGGRFSPIFCPEFSRLHIQRRETLPRDKLFLTQATKNADSRLYHQRKKQ